MTGIGKYVIFCIACIVLMFNLNVVSQKNTTIESKKTRLDAKTQVIETKDTTLNILQDIISKSQLDTHRTDLFTHDVEYAYLYHRIGSKMGADEYDLIVGMSRYSSLIVPVVTSIIIYNDTFKNEGGYLRIPKTFFTKQATDHADGLFVKKTNNSSYNDLGLELGVLDYYIREQGAVRAFHNIYSKEGYDGIGEVYHILTGEYLETRLTK